MKECNVLYNGKNYRTIWLAEDDETVVEIIDQRYIPFEFVIERITNVKEMAVAIKDMHLRGAPLIGAAAAYGIYLAALEARGREDYNHFLEEAKQLLWETRPTAVNLHWALKRAMAELAKVETIEEKIAAAKGCAQAVADEDVEICRNIGLYGVELIEEIAKRKNGEPVQVLTHCNAGILATVEHGTATSPIYEAHRRGINLHVWVDETRPRNQGKITSWELENHGISNTVICDNTGGHLMQHGMVDIVIVGTDRVAANGDVANKIGTYLKALAANDNSVPFYVALPSTTFDLSIENGVRDIPIEERSDEEVLYIDGLKDGKMETVRLFSPKAKGANYGFDVTPARLVTGFITEKGLFKPEEVCKVVED